MTATTPYPENHCKLLVYDCTSSGFMCSIGNCSHTCDVLKELYNSFSGDANDAFEEIINLLQN